MLDPETYIVVLVVVVVAAVEGECKINEELEVAAFATNKENVTAKSSKLHTTTIIHPRFVFFVREECETCIFQYCSTLPPNGVLFLYFWAVATSFLFFFVIQLWLTFFSKCHTDINFLESYFKRKNSIHFVPKINLF
jgi:hypothetical protein